MPQSNKVRQAFAIAQHQEEKSVVKDSRRGPLNIQAVQARIAKRTDPRTGKPYGMKKARAILRKRRSLNRS